VIETPSGGKARSTLVRGVTFEIAGGSLETPLSGPADVDAQLKWLGATLLTHSIFLNSLGRTAELRVNCNLMMPRDIATLSLSPEALRACTEVGSRLEFSVTFVHE